MKKGTMIWKIFIVMAVIGMLAAVGVMAGEGKMETITGTLQQTDEGIVLSADNGDRLMVKGKDVSEMVGKPVRATGAVMEDESGMTIDITSIEEVSEDTGSMAE